MLRRRSRTDLEDVTAHVKAINIISNGFIFSSKSNAPKPFAVSVTPSWTLERQVSLMSP